MTAHVFPEVSLLNESVAANRTNSFSFGVAPVNLDVVVPGGPVPERPAALVAAVRLFPGMQPHVAFKLVLACQEERPHKKDEHRRAKI